ncbi:MAG: hypothetical protein K8S16_03920 [Bacteroidales bacterium]|nr:hypothetical protein [Bacteroidales bacterium]
MKYLLPILLLLIYNSLFSQYSFEYTIASDEDELLLNGIEDNDKNFILVGRKGNYVEQIWDSYIIKIYPNGDTLSKTFYKADTNGYFKTIELLDDGNYLIIGSYAINNGWNYDHLLVYKIDTSLNILFQKSYKVSTDFYFRVSYIYSFTDSDQNIVLAGSAKYYTNYPNYHWDMTFAKLNQQGDTLLTKTHHYQFGQSVDNISQVPNSKDYLAIAGNFNLHNFGPVRLDSAFNILDIKHFYNNMKHP